MKFFIGCMGCLALSVAFYLVWVTGVFNTLDSLPMVTKEPNSNLSTYLSFVSVMMTAVTVVLAVFAITLGVISFYTIKEIKERAIERATQVAIEQAQKSLHPDNIEKIVMKSMLDSDPNEEMDDTKNNDS